MLFYIIFGLLICYFAYELYKKIHFHEWENWEESYREKESPQYSYSNGWTIILERKCSTCNMKQLKKVR